MLICIASATPTLSLIMKLSKGGKSMFSENLKSYRKQKGLSQEELAERLHVVRQTVSKWERGLSIPDADLLIRVAEIFDTSVSTLLGETVEELEKKDTIAEKLEQLNALLAERNRRSRRIWKIVGIVLISMAVMTILFFILSIVAFGMFTVTDSVITTETIILP